MVVARLRINASLPFMSSTSAKVCLFSEVTEGSCHCGYLANCGQSALVAWAYEQEYRIA